MTRVVAIGSSRRIEGFALAGVDVRVAEDAREAHVRLDELGGRVGLLILTPEAATALEGRQSERDDAIWVTLPA